MQMVVGLCRRTRDFTDRERGLLELLDPHIAHAYRAAEEREKICSAARWKSLIAGW